MNEWLVGEIEAAGMTPIEVSYTVKAANGRWINRVETLAREVYPEVREGGSFTTTYRGRKVLGHVTKVEVIDSPTTASEE